MSLKGKVYAVTAGGQGIGLAAARILASRGATLALADVNANALADVEREFKANSWPVTTTTLDVRSPVDVEKWVADIVTKFGKLDGAANVVGVIGKQWGRAAVHEIEDDDWNFVLGVNVTGELLFWHITRCCSKSGYC